LHESSCCRRPREHPIKQMISIGKEKVVIKYIVISIIIQNYHSEFLTATIFNWNHLLKEDIYKKLVVDSFQWLVKEKKCIINTFVIMPNHFHLISKISDGLERKNVQGALFNFTAH
jgi:REP element-mobilizing transposase RayT